MKKTAFIFALLLSLATVRTYAADDEQKISFSVNVSDELANFDIKKQDLECAVTNKLVQAKILVQDEETNPKLILKIYHIEAGTYVVAFINLTFSEPAKLTRNNLDITATTFSRATLMAAPKGEFASSVMNAVTSMTDAFINDYQKAYQKE